MRVRIFDYCLLAVITSLMSGCAPLFTQLFPATATSQARPLAPESLYTATLEPTPALTATSTQAPFILEFTPVPTETPLPTLELPTEVARPLALQVWDGLPTYPAESKPDYYFRLRFDPGVWALTTDNFGFPALGHRGIPDCIISPASGRGLPLNGTVEHAVRRIGSISFQVNSAYVNGVRQFVNYAAGDGSIYTAFEVSFSDQSDQCLTDAETVLATLRSVPVSQATPIPAP